jgi:hypothetical protein
MILYGGLRSVPFIAIFLASWIAFLLFADRSKWRQFVPACLMAMVLSLTTDVIVATNLKLWTYHDPTGWILQDDFVHLLDDFGIYPVVTYLFLQHYPFAKNRLQQFMYFVYWTTFAIMVEYAHHIFGLMKHANGWSHLHSYIADWVLLFSLFLFYKTYNREPNESRRHRTAPSS